MSKNFLHSSPHRTAFWLLIFTGLVGIIGIGSMVYVSMDKTDQDAYTISPVPYVGLHNNADRYRQPHALCDTGSSLISVIEYWQPAQNDIAQLFEAFPYCRNYTPTEAIAAVEALNPQSGVSYSVDSVRLEFSDIYSYINNSTRTPLITYLPLTTDQPQNLQYYPTVVIHGIDPESQTITYHDYWHGPNRTISFPEFQERQAMLPEQLRQLYVVIQPEDFSDPDTFTFPPQSRDDLAAVPDAATNTETVALYDDLALAEGAYGLEKFDLAKVYFQRMVLNPTFETALPKAFQVWELYRYADVLGNGLHEYEEALTVIADAEERNFDLDDSYRYYDSFSYLFANNAEPHRDKLSYVFIIKGDIYRHQGLYGEAIEAYEQALEIYPNHQGPQEMIAELIQAFEDQDQNEQEEE